MLATLAAAVILASPFSGATTTRICGAKTIPFQQSALTVSGTTLWLAVGSVA